VAHQAVTCRTSSLAAVARLFNRDESSLKHGIAQVLPEPLMQYPVSRPGTDDRDGTAGISTIANNSKHFLISPLQKDHEQ
jgi:hypothetical protein